MEFKLAIQSNNENNKILGQKKSEIKQKFQKDAKDLDDKFRAAKYQYGDKFTSIMSTNEIKMAIKEIYKHLCSKVEEYQKEYQSAPANENCLKDYRQAVLKLEQFVKSDLEEVAKSRIKIITTLEQKHAEFAISKFSLPKSMENDFRALDATMIKRFNDAQNTYSEEDIDNFKNSMIRFEELVNDPKSYQKRKREFVELYLEADGQGIEWKPEFDAIQKKCPEVAKVLLEEDRKRLSKTGASFRQFDACHTQKALDEYRQSNKEYQEFLSKPFHYTFLRLKEEYQSLTAAFEKSNDKFNEKGDKNNEIEQEYQKIKLQCENASEEYDKRIDSFKHCTLDSPNTQVLKILETCAQSIADLKALTNDSYQHFFDNLQKSYRSLKKDYQLLEKDYQLLKEDYQLLEKDYQSLKEDLQEGKKALAEYTDNDLFQKYNQLKEHFKSNLQSYHDNPTSETLGECISTLKAFKGAFNDLKGALNDLKGTVRQTIVKALKNAYEKYNSERDAYRKKFVNNKEQKLVASYPERFQKFHTSLSQAEESLKKIEKNSTDGTFTEFRQAVLALLDVAENPVTKWNLTRINERTSDNKSIAKRFSSSFKGAFGADDRITRANNLINLFNGGLDENEKKLSFIQSLSEENQKALVKAHTSLVETFGKLASQSIDYSQSHKYREEKFNEMKRCEEIMNSLNTDPDNWQNLIEEQRNLIITIL